MIPEDLNILHYNIYIYITFVSRFLIIPDLHKGSDVPTAVMGAQLRAHL